MHWNHITMIDYRKTVVNNFMGYMGLNLSITFKVPNPLIRFQLGC